MNILRLIIRRFDDWLSHTQGVEPFTDDPQVILRLQQGCAAWEIPLPDGHIPLGTNVLFIHLWNERIPLIPTQGPDLGWARHTQRLMIHSYNCIGQHIQDTPTLLGVKAVGGISAQISLSGANGGRALLERLGFTIFPYHRPAGVFGEFWENFYTWWLMWAFNPASVRQRGLFDLQRNEFWMTREKFLKRFGGILII
jgi:hypothetical protein